MIGSLQFLIPGTELKRHSEIPTVQDKTTQIPGSIPGAVLHIPCRVSKIKALLIQQPVLHSYSKKTIVQGLQYSTMKLSGTEISLFLAEGPMLCYFVPELIRLSLITINFRSQC